MALPSRAIMHVIAALDEQRQTIAQFIEHFGRPGTQRDDGLLARMAAPATLVLQPPSDSLKPIGLACNERAAEPLEQLEILR